VGEGKECLWVCEDCGDGGGEGDDEDEAEERCQGVVGGGMRGGSLRAGWAHDVVDVLLGLLTILGILGPSLRHVALPDAFKQFPC
jgi:hypothetical protein